MTNDITQNQTLTLTRRGWEFRVGMGMVVLYISPENILRVLYTLFPDI